MIRIEHGDMTHFIDTEVLIEYLCGCPKTIKDKIKDNIVYLDFKNADIDDFIKHLAAGMVEVRFR